MFEFNDSRLGKISLEIQNVREVCPTPAVNRLPVIANHANILRRINQFFYNRILRRIRVLILIDEYVLEVRTPLVTNVRLIK